MTQHLVLSGPSGSGKTQLVQAFVRSLEGRLDLGGLVLIRVAADDETSFVLEDLGEGTRSVVAHSRFVSHHHSRGCGVDPEAVGYAGQLALSAARSPQLWIVDGVGPILDVAPGVLERLKQLLSGSEPVLLVASHDSEHLAALEDIVAGLERYSFEPDRPGETADRLKSFAEEISNASKASTKD